MRRRKPPTTIKQAPRTPYVTFEPRAHAAVQRGINMLADAVRPTLGPLPRLVAVEPVGPGDKRPEMLDNAGLVARRFLALPDRDADVGAMFCRHVLWRQYERAGDGTATTAVLFQSIYNQGITYIAAGGNAARLRRFLEQGLRLIREMHAAMAVQLKGQQEIARAAQALCHDAALADTLGEVFDIVGEHGGIEVRSGRGRAVERTYVLGTYFKGRLLSDWMVTDQLHSRAELHDAAVLVSDLSFDDPSELVPLLRLAGEMGIEALMVVARELSEQAIAALLAAGRVSPPCRIIAVKAPDAVSGQPAMLDDLAVLTGGRLFLSAAGDTLRKIKPEDLGHARRAWGDGEYFGVAGGKGAPRAIRAHVAALRAAVVHAEDPETRAQLRERAGKLMGGTAVVWVGGTSEIEIKARKELAERTVAAVRATLGRGVVPGGGISLLACRPRLVELADQSDDPDERMAYRILSRALAEPARTILRNAGYDPAAWLDRIERAGRGCGLDVLTGAIVDMAAAGIVDSAGVLDAALHEAVASAALALTIDVLVHTRLPELSFEP